MDALPLAPVFGQCMQQDQGQLENRKKVAVFAGDRDQADGAQFHGTRLQKIDSLEKCQGTSCKMATLSSPSTPGQKVTSHAA